MFFGFFTFAYYLRGKEFTVQVDHANLTYLGDNQTPIVVRWRIFMQSFIFKVQRIPGTRMGLADYMSRMYPEVDSDEDKVQSIKEDDELLVIGMALDLLLLEESSDSDDRGVCYTLDAKPILNKNKLRMNRLITPNMTLTIILVNVMVGVSFIQVSGERGYH